MKTSSYLLILCIVALSLYVGCDRDKIVSTENNPPEIESIRSNPSSSLTNRIAGGSTVELSVIAKDPDGDELFFMWEAEHGQFDGEVNKSTVQWISPVVESEMDCLIKVSVSDGLLTVQGNITLHIDNFIVPTVTTFEITDITDTTAVGGGEIIDTGGSDVIAFGLVWSKSPDPTLEENDGYTADSTATGAFSHEITGLDPNTEYHIKAYATNKAGSAYGAQILFTTRLVQYNISGRVTENETGMSDVTITASGGYSHTVSTNSDGEYTIAGVPRGVDITITPDRADYEFSPKSRSISNITEDHTGIDFAGTLATSASVSVSPTSHDYGDVIVDQNASATFTVQNTGTAAMSGQISLAGTAANQYTITSGGGSYTINAGQSRSVTVRFNPTSTGRKEATLRITHDAANTSSPVDVTLRGDGVAAFYSISGRVSELGYTYALSDVEIEASGGHSQTVKTNWDGVYTITDVPHGATVTIKPTRIGFRFTPESRTISNITQNQTGIDFEYEYITYQISGRVTEDGSGLGGVTITASGDISIKVTTNSNGDYMLVVFEGVNITLTPSRDDYRFEPTTMTFLNVQQNITEVNFIARLFITGTVTDIDGNIYPTVKIANQWWMASNLRTTRYRNGMSIARDDRSIYNESYGYLYNWSAVSDSRGLCPTGWQVPSDDCWMELERNLGMQGVNDSGWRGRDEGGKLKSTRTEPTRHPRWNRPNYGATDETGWSGLPGGVRISDGSFTGLGEFGMWWSSSVQPDRPDGIIKELEGIIIMDVHNSEIGSAWMRSLDYDRSTVGRGAFPMNFGLSVRCVRNMY